MEEVASCPALSLLAAVRQDTPAISVKQVTWLLPKSLSMSLSRGGGGGTQIWFRRGCAAEAAKPVPIFKGHFGRKGYPLLGVFIQENDVLCTLATKWAKISSIYSKITKVGGMFRDFLGKKVTHFSGTPPFTILGEYPPPPPGLSLCFCTFAGKCSLICHAIDSKHCRTRLKRQFFFLRKRNRGLSITYNKRLHMKSNEIRIVIEVFDILISRQFTLLFKILL